MFKRIATFTLAVPLMAGGFVFAEDKATVKTEVKTETADMARMDHQRLSKFMKKDVHDQAGKDIGDIKDVVFEGNSNRAAYVVVSYGGIMGMGDKLFAVPWNAFDFRADAKDANDYTVHMAVAEEQLKNAPGFDDKNWPDMADANFRSQVDTFYNTHTKKDMKSDMKREMDKAENKIAGPTDNKGLVWTRRASQVIGADVHNKADEELGDIKDLVVDTRTGRIHYAVLSFGGVMGIGDKLFAVPMDSLASKHDDKKFVLDASKDQLKNAPGFDDKSWPDFASTDFRKGVDDYYRHDKTTGNKTRTVTTPMD